MVRLRLALAPFYRMEPPTALDIHQAMSYLHQLEKVIKDDDMHNMEMCFVCEEQANLVKRLGGKKGLQEILGKAVGARMLCLGYDHPSSREALAKRHQMLQA